MIEGVAIMQTITTVILVLILLPAALAGLGGALTEAVGNIDCVAAALPHAQHLLAEITPLAPAGGLLLAGILSLGIAGWLIVRIVNNG